jgi:hypothetical protein
VLLSRGCGGDHDGKREDETTKNKEITARPAAAKLVGFCAAKVPGVVEVGSCLCFRGQNRNRG